VLMSCADEDDECAAGKQIEVTNPLTRTSTCHIPW